MLGTFWLAQHTLLGILGRCDRTLTWIHLGFLSWCPCSHFPLRSSRTSSICAWRWACTGSTSCCSAPRWNGALGTGAPRSCRIALAALICLISPPASVIALAVVQLYFIVSPRLPGTWRQRRGGGPDD